MEEQIAVMKDNVWTEHLFSLLTGDRSWGDLLFMYHSYRKVSEDFT